MGIVGPEPTPEQRRELDEAMAASLRTLRLEKLLKEYEAACESDGNQPLRHVDNPGWTLDYEGENVFKRLTVEQAAKGHFQVAIGFGPSGHAGVGGLAVPDTIKTSARRYIVARDYNVWKDGQWQMVWKLQYP